VMSKDFHEFLAELELDLDRISGGLKSVSSSRRESPRTSRRAFDRRGLTGSGHRISEPGTPSRGFTIGKPVRFHTRPPRVKSEKREERLIGDRFIAGNYKAWPVRESAAARVYTPRRLQFSAYMSDRKVSPIVFGIPVKTNELAGPSVTSPRSCA
jgi:hypothetical protein